MSSSTSSSDRRAPPVAAEAGSRRSVPLLVGLGFLAVLLLLEVVTRVVLFPASKDYSRFATYPARARALCERPGRTLALVGNSATERGVDLPLLESSLAAAGITDPVDVFVADGSHISTWYWIAEREFWKQGLRPDRMVLHFYNDLADGGALEVPRLARFFTDRSDWPEVFAHDLPDLDRRADFVVSSGWAMFAARDRIRERVFDIIPGYKDYVQAANAVNFGQQRAEGADRAATGKAPRARTFRDLERLLARAKQVGTRLVFVAFPIHPDPGVPLYRVDDTERHLISAAGMELVDLHEMPELRAEHYEDEIHLNEAGRRVYTPRLAAALAGLPR